MNKWKLSFFIVVPTLIVSNIFFVYLTLDSSVSLTYLNHSFGDEKKARHSLGQLMIHGSSDYSQKDFLHLLRQVNPNDFIVEEGQEIRSGGNVFTFKNDRLTEVK